MSLEHLAIPGSSGTQALQINNDFVMGSYHYPITISDDEDSYQQQSNDKCDLQGPNAFDSDAESLPSLDWLMSPYNTAIPNLNWLTSTRRENPSMPPAFSNFDLLSSTASAEPSFMLPTFSNLHLLMTAASTSTETPSAFIPAPQPLLTEEGPLPLQQSQFMSPNFSNFDVLTSAAATSTETPSAFIPATQPLLTEEGPLPLQQSQFMSPTFSNFDVLTSAAATSTETPSAFMSVSQSLLTEERPLPLQHFLPIPEARQAPKRRRTRALSQKRRKTAKKIKLSLTNISKLGENVENNVNCSICIENIIPGQHITFLRCLHRFHSICIGIEYEVSRKPPRMEFYDEDNGIVVKCPICQEAHYETDMTKFNIPVRNFNEADQDLLKEFKYC